MPVVPGTSQNGLISIDEVLKNTATEDVVLQAGAKYLIDNNIRIFNHSILTISKFSDQLHLEPSADGLSLKALNSSKSAFASILFTRHFFSDSDVSKIDAAANNLCRISMRSALAIFGRVGSHSDRAQLSCRLQVDPRADYLIAQMSYKHFVTKCFVIPFRDCVVTYKHLFNDKSKLRNRLTLQARILLTVLTQIGTDMDEVKIIATSENFTIERFFTTDDDRARVRKSDAHIDVDVFDRYLLQHPSEVAVNLKELKAVLTFADATGMPVNLHFDQPGRPIIVAVEENADFMAEFVLATFESPQTSFYDEAAVVEPVGTEADQLKAGKSQDAVITEEPMDCHDSNGDQLGILPALPLPPPDFGFLPPSNGGCRDRAKPVTVAETAADMEHFADDLPLESNRFDDLDNDILAEPLPKSLPIDHEKSADNELLLAEMRRLDTAGREFVGEITANETIDLDSRDENVANAVMSQMIECEVDRPPMQPSVISGGKEIAPIVIDDVNLWNATQQDHSENANLASDALNAGPSTAELVAELVSDPLAVQPPATRQAEAAPVSQLYDCINLSCSPSAYLEGDRPFNIRLSESQTERLHQINCEMPSQSQVDDGLSTSFVGRLLDAAVEKTMPTGSRRNSSSAPVVMMTVASTETVNPDTGNFAPAGHAFDASQSMIEVNESLLQSIDSAELNQLESAVELLQNRFGGFKRRPNTQHFLQEQLELVHHLNIFGSTRGSSTPNRNVGICDATTSNSSSPSAHFALPEDSNRLKTPQQRRHDDLQLTVISNIGSTSTVTPIDRINLNRASARSTAAMSRPLAEIDRDLHSDNSLDHPLVIDERIAPPDLHDISDDVIVVADSIRPLASVRPSAPRPRTSVTVASDHLGLEPELNDSVGPSSSRRINREVVSAKTVAPKAPTTAKSARRALNVGAGGSALQTGKQRQKRSDAAAPSAAAVASSKSSVLLLEEDYGCEGGWLWKPNTQRSQISGLPPTKSTQSKRPAGRTKRINSTDEELERILVSVNNFSDERRRAAYRTANGMGRGPEPATEDEQWRKRPSVKEVPRSSSRTANVSRPLRKKPTLADELALRPLSPARIESQSVVVLTSPKKRRG